VYLKKGKQEQNTKERNLRTIEDNVLGGGVDEERTDNVRPPWKSRGRKEQKGKKVNEGGKKVSGR